MFKTQDGQVCALNTDTAQLRWEFDAKDMRALSATEVTVVGDQVWFGSKTRAGAYVCALDINTGKETWKRETVLAPCPVVAEGVVYFRTLQGLCAVDIESKQEKWVFKEKRSAPAVANAVAHGTVYFTRKGVIYAIDATTGHQQWVFKTRGPVHSSPSIARRILYVGSDDGCIYAIHTGSGKEAWRGTSGDAIRSSPAIVDGAVYVGSEDGIMYRIRR